jgi:hypothetical protein
LSRACRPLRELEPLIGGRNVPAATDAVAFLRRPRLDGGLFATRNVADGAAFAREGKDQATAVLAAFIVDDRGLLLADPLGLGCLTSDNRRGDRQARAGDRFVRARSRLSAELVGAHGGAGASRARVRARGGVHGRDAGIALDRRSAARRAYYGPAVVFPALNGDTLVSGVS